MFNPDDYFELSLRANMYRQFLNSEVHEKDYTAVQVWSFFFSKLSFYAQFESWDWEQKDKKTERKFDYWFLIFYSNQNVISKLI